MPIKHAIELLNAIDVNEEMRKQMYGYNNPDELMSYLHVQGYAFTQEEFEDAVRILHLNCQSYEEADFLLQKADWLRFQLLIKKEH